MTMIRGTVGIIAIIITVAVTALAGEICAECRFTAKSRFRSRARSKKPDDKIAAAISAVRPSDGEPKSFQYRLRD